MARLPVVISASILASDFARLGEEALGILSAGADWLHFDVMDNHYVPNLSVGPMVLKSLREYCPKAVLDVHLMTAPVDDLIIQFAKAGANRIAIHPEATGHLDRSLSLIIDQGCEAGVVYNPSQHPCDFDWIVDKLSFVLLMTVNPGFGGQKLEPFVLSKVALLRSMIDGSGRSIRLQVDGGVNGQNISKLAHLGADTFVVGSYLFGSSNWASCIEDMRKNASG